MYKAMIKFAAQQRHLSKAFVIGRTENSLTEIINSFDVFFFMWC